MKHTVTKVKLENGAKDLFIDVPGATVMDFEFNFRAGEYLVARKNGKCRIYASMCCLALTKNIQKPGLSRRNLKKTALIAMRTQALTTLHTNLNALNLNGKEF
jgi:hypothetical protein